MKKPQVNPYTQKNIERLNVLLQKMDDINLEILEFKKAYISDNSFEIQADKNFQTIPDDDTPWAAKDICDVHIMDTNILDNNDNEPHLPINHSATEIERKFLIPVTTNEISSKMKNVIIVETAYISIEPEVRIRKCTEDLLTSYILSFKSNGNITRDEVETEISEYTYNALIKAFIGNKDLILKWFYRIPLKDGNLCELSVVDPLFPSTFTYMEVEFPSLEAADAFVLPDWLSNSIEVTYDQHYKMKKYWERTRCELQ